MADSTPGKGEVNSTSIPMNEFASTTKLAPKENNNVEDPDYNPFRQRKIEKVTTDAGAMAHLLKGSLGTGILAMPMAFKNGGMWFGIVGTLVIGLICTHCVQILVKSSHILCWRTNTPALDFSQTAEMAFESGPKSFKKYSRAAKLFVKYALMATYYSAVCVYVVFVADSFKEIAEHYGFEQPVQIFMLIIFPVLLGLGVIKNLKFLVPFSALANFFIVISFSITLYYMFREIKSIDGHTAVGEIQGIPLFFGSVIFAMEGIGVVMPIENTMTTPEHFLGCPGILNISMGIVVALYAVIGFFGYLQFGDDTKATITQNLPVEEGLAQAVKIMIGLAIMFSYGLQLFVPTSITWELISHKFREDRRNIYYYVFKIFVVILTVAVGAAVPQLGPLISLVGAVFFSTLGLFCPAVIETITLWDGQLGKFKYILWKNVIIILFALFALLTGTYTSIQEIISAYS